VNRTAADPVEIDIVADVCLPLTVDEVRQWAGEEKELGNWLEMAVEGAVLDSPSDAAKIWPAVWETEGGRARVR
jgi:hypothetical protein